MKDSLVVGTKTAMQLKWQPNTAFIVPPFVLFHNSYKCYHNLHFVSTYSFLQSLGHHKSQMTLKWSKLQHLLTYVNVVYRDFFYPLPKYYDLPTAWQHQKKNVSD